MPLKVIIDVGDDLIVLRRLLANPELPTIDLDALLSYVVDLLHHDPTAEYELNDTSNILQLEMLGDRGDIEDPWDSVLAMETILTHIRTIGNSIRQKLKQIPLYEGEFLNFDYDGALDARTIILRRRGR